MGFKDAADDNAGVDHMGRERLLMSLRQIEYIQYYINTMRIAEQGWVEYLTIRAAAIEAGVEPPRPPERKGEGIWIPLPDTVRLRSEFVTLVSASTPKIQVDPTYIASGTY